MHSNGDNNCSTNSSSSSSTGSNSGSMSAADRFQVWCRIRPLTPAELQRGDYSAATIHPNSNTNMGSCSTNNNSFIQGSRSNSNSRNSNGSNSISNIVVGGSGGGDVAGGSNNLVYVASKSANFTPRTYKVDGIFDCDYSQEQVFSQLVPVLESSLLLDSAMGSSNFSLFSYGQTGTGKTYTMLGYDFFEKAKSGDGNGCDGSSAAAPFNFDNDLPAYFGIIPRTMQWLFRKFDLFASNATTAEGLKMDLGTISVSYLEIYNEKILDLLTPVPSAPPEPAFDTYKSGGNSSFGISPSVLTALPSLELRERRSGEIVVQGLTVVQVKDLVEVFELLWAGAKTRSMAATDMNEYSSRSHTVFQITIDVSTSSNSNINKVKRTKISLIDLAGSEKWRTHHSHTNNLSQERIKEMTSINKSLSALGNCISALMKMPSRVHVPYRDSKLTRLLQDSLGGNTRTMFIVTISPSISCIEETTSTLQFADRAMKVRTNSNPNSQNSSNSSNSSSGTRDGAYNSNSSRIIEKYEHDIVKLKSIVRLLLESRGDCSDLKGLIPEIDDIFLDDPSNLRSLPTKANVIEHNIDLGVLQHRLEGSKERAPSSKEKLKTKNKEKMTMSSSNESSSLYDARRSVDLRASPIALDESQSPRSLKQSDEPFLLPDNEGSPVPMASLMVDLQTSFNNANYHPNPSFNRNSINNNSSMVSPRAAAAMVDESLDSRKFRSGDKYRGDSANSSSSSSSIPVLKPSLKPPLASSGTFPTSSTAGISYENTGVEVANAPPTSVNMHKEYIKIASQSAEIKKMKTTIEKQDENIQALKTRIDKMDNEYTIALKELKRSNNKLIQEIKDSRVSLKDYTSTSSFSSTAASHNAKSREVAQDGNIDIAVRLKRIEDFISDQKLSSNLSSNFRDNVDNFSAERFDAKIVDASISQYKSAVNIADWPSDKASASDDDEETNNNNYNCDVDDSDGNDKCDDKGSFNVRVESLMFSDSSRTELSVSREAWRDPVKTNLLDKAAESNPSSHRTAVPSLMALVPSAVTNHHLDLHDGYEHDQRQRIQQPSFSSFIPDRSSDRNSLADSRDVATGPNFGTDTREFGRFTATPTSSSATGSIVAVTDVAAPSSTLPPALQRRLLLQQQRQKQDETDLHSQSAPVFSTTNKSALMLQAEAIFARNVNKIPSPRNFNDRSDGFVETVETGRAGSKPSVYDIHTTDRSAWSARGASSLGTAAQPEKDTIDFDLDLGQSLELEVEDEDEVENVEELNGVRDGDLITSSMGRSPKYPINTVFSEVFTTPLTTSNVPLKEPLVAVNAISHESGVKGDNTSSSLSASYKTSAESSRKPSSFGTTKVDNKPTPKTTTNATIIKGVKGKDKMKKDSSMDNKPKPLWRSYLDPNSGLYYYHNKLTNETTWEAPTTDQMRLMVLNNEIVIL